MEGGEVPIGNKEKQVTLRGGISEGKLIIKLRRKFQILEEGKDKRMWIGKEKKGVKLGKKNYRNKSKEKKQREKNNHNKRK